MKYDESAIPIGGSWRALVEPGSVWTDEQYKRMQEENRPTKAGM